MTFHERLALIDRVALVGKITLPNGMTGTISGHRNDFATFHHDTTGLTEEYAWQSIERFRSTT
jgi:hypothetical protein